ncbi:hypothetical protein EW145_g6232 [Phellinidium pouzarii]|uniref:Fungal-type protein kinase domain-containing protein n=1 Tax=Phellinidium pouzarii TaxID=167371 RepID=A0A4S4KZ18_9AGAM|nr:hypothetical protein EW145_g6232 [Phellinidium pouzarii]
MATPEDRKTRDEATTRYANGVAHHSSNTFNFTGAVGDVNKMQLCLNKRMSLSIELPYGLIDRGGGVRVMKCKTLEPPAGNQDREYALKMSWISEPRMSEAKIIELAKNALGMRDAKEKYSPRLVDCLPRVFLSKDLLDLQYAEEFRCELGAFTEENRIFRMIAFELMVPIYEVKDLDVYKQAFREIVQGHHFLFVCEQKIKHRDISVENLMVRVIDKNTMEGVLNDWDLAKVGRSMDHIAKGPWTGTLPYMDGHGRNPVPVPTYAGGRVESTQLRAAALCLLPSFTCAAVYLLVWLPLDLFPSVSTPPPVHSERFKWESFFYILYWIACHYDKGEYVKCDALDDWLDSDSRTLFKTKNTVLTRPDYRLITVHFLPLAKKWIHPLNRLFLKGHDARTVHKINEIFETEDRSIFNGETLGGHVTYEVWKIFET